MFETLPGFRDFPPEARAKRNHLFRIFRNVARHLIFKNMMPLCWNPLICTLKNQVLKLRLSLSFRG